MCGMLALDSASLLAIVRRMLVWGTSVCSGPSIAVEVGLAPEKQENTDQRPIKPPLGSESILQDIRDL